MNDDDAMAAEEHAMAAEEHAMAAEERTRHLVAALAKITAAETLAEAKTHARKALGIEVTRRTQEWSAKPWDLIPGLDPPVWIVGGGLRRAG